MTEIPKDIQQFGAELAALAKRHGLRFLDGKFSPALDSTWHNDVHFRWEDGRHGAESFRISLHSIISVSVKVTPDSAPAARTE